MIHFPPADRGQTELFGEPDRLALLSLAAHIVVIDDEDDQRADADAACWSAPASTR